MLNLRRLSAVTAALIGAILTVTSAQALDRRVRIVNDSKVDIVEFYGSHVGEAPSDEDMLGEDDLPPGKSVVLNFDDGSGYCRFAFRAVFDDGVELTRPSVNVCEVGTYRYTD
jgi:hypothetical protein